MKLIENFCSSDLVTKILLLCLTIGVWTIVIQNIVGRNKTQDVYVVNTVDANVLNSVTVDVNDEIDVNVQHWDGWRVGSHHGYVDNKGNKHVAIDVFKNGGW